MQAAAKCSVCLACVRPPITLCVNGHMICTVCKPAATCNGNVCPYCKCDFSDINCVHINSILTILPKDQNSECNSTFCEGTEHCSTCEVRLTKCYIIGCQWKGPVKSLINHLYQNHKNVPILDNKNCSLGYITQLKQISTSNKVPLFTSPILSHGCLYWKHTKIDKDKEMILIFLTSVPTNSDHMRTVSVIKFGKDDKEFTYSQKILDQNVKVNEVFERVECISVPFSMLDSLVNLDGRVNYTCEIIKFEKSTYDLFQF